MAINEVWDRYHKAIIVSENGLGTYDTLTIDKKIHDDYRIKYLKEHIQQMKICIDEGVKVIGYTSWGCIDIVVQGLLSAVNDMDIFMLIVTITVMGA